MKKVSKKSIKINKIVTSCAGDVDGMKKSIDNNLPITHQNQSKLFRQKVCGLVHLLMQKFSCQAYTLGPRPFLMK